MRSALPLSLLVATLVVGCKRSEAAEGAQGGQLFATACARCHGPEGTGGLPLYQGGPSPRNFHDAAFQDSRTDEQLKQTIKSGKGTGMPPFGTTFDEAQLTALVAQIRRFGSDKAEKKDR